MTEAFTRAMQIAGQTFLEDTLYSSHIPNWNRAAAILDFLDRLRDLGRIPELLRQTGHRQVPFFNQKLTIIYPFLNSRQLILR